MYMFRAFLAHHQAALQVV